MTAARRDIADVALADRLFAPHYARALPRRCGPVAVMVRQAGSASATAVTQLLPGEDFAVLDIGGGWAWGYCRQDGYVGYVPEAMLVMPDAPATHSVTTRIAPVFAAADIKSAVALFLPLGSRFAADRDGDFLALADGGFVHTRHAAAIDATVSDPVAFACSLVGMPYLWGGRGAGGIDCSGLVQQALARAGIAAPRDSDQQRDAIGYPLDADAPLRRGDILFFPGHVGLLVDAETLVHANAHWMAVTIEPLADVVARIAASHPTPITARRRLP